MTVQTKQVCKKEIIEAWPGGDRVEVNYTRGTVTLIRQKITSDPNSSQIFEMSLEKSGKIWAALAAAHYKLREQLEGLSVNSKQPEPEIVPVADVDWLE